MGLFGAGIGSVVGGFLGSFFGPAGQFIGSIGGGLLGGLIGGGPKTINRYHQRSTPRLTDLNVTFSTYGKAIAKCFGTHRFGVNVIWAPNPAIEEVIIVDTTFVEQKSGEQKTRDVTTTTTYLYFITMAAAAGEGTGNEEILSVWMNNELVWDRTDGNTAKYADLDLNFKFYSGGTVQTQNKTMSDDVTAALNPAYRHLAYVLFYRLPLARFDNRIPDISVELSCNNSQAFPLDRFNDNTGESIGATNYYIDWRRGRLFRLSGHDDVTPGSGVLHGHVIDLYSDTAIVNKAVTHLGQFDGGNVGKNICIGDNGFIYAGMDSLDAFGGDDFGGYVFKIEPVSLEIVKEIQIWDDVNPPGPQFLMVFPYFHPVGAKFQIYTAEPATTPLSRGGLLEVEIEIDPVDVFGPEAEDCDVDYAVDDIGGLDQVIAACMDRDQNIWAIDQDNDELRHYVTESYVAIDTDPLTEECLITIGVNVTPTTVVADLTQSPYLLAAGTGFETGIAYNPINHTLVIVGLGTTANTQRFIVYDIATGTVTAEKTVDTITEGEFEGVGFTFHSLGNSPGFVKTHFYAMGSQRYLTRVDLEDLTFTQEVDLHTDIASGGDGADGFGGIWDPLTESYIFDEEEGDPPNDWARLFLDRHTIDTVGLDVVVGEMLQRGGLVAADYDLTGLSSVTMRGLNVSNPSTLRDAIALLQRAYHFDLVESDFKIVGSLRGSASSVSIGVDDLGTGESPAEFHLSETRVQEREKPMRMTVQYSDYNKHYELGTQTSKRYVFGSNRTSYSRTEEIEDMEALALDATGAKAIADRLLFSEWAERSQIEASVNLEYAGVDVADVITLTDNNASHVIRVDSMDIGAGNAIELKGLTEQSSVYGLGFATSELGGIPAQIVRIARGTEPLIFDIPFLRDDHYVGDISTGVYMGLGPHDSSWPGAIGWRSGDSGQTWNSVGGRKDLLTWGYARALAAPPAVEAWDDTNTLTVVLVNGTLSNATDEEAVLNGTENWAILGKEVIGFQFATLNGDGTYSCTHLLRGRRCTGAYSELHEAGEVFVLLNNPSDNLLLRVPIPLAARGTSQQFRAVTSGQKFGDGLWTALHFSGNDLMPCAPNDLKALSDDSDNVIVSWIRQSRVDENLGFQDGDTDEVDTEYPEKYECVLHTKGSTTEEAVVKITTQFEQPSVIDIDLRINPGTAPWANGSISQLSSDVIGAKSVSGADVHMGNTTGQMTSTGTDFTAFDVGDWVWVGHATQDFTAPPTNSDLANNRPFKVGARTSTTLDLVDEAGNQPLTIQDLTEGTVVVYVPATDFSDFQVGARVKMTGWTTDTNNTEARLMAVTPGHLELEFTAELETTVTQRVIQLPTHAVFSAADIAAAGYSVGEDITVSVYKCSAIVGRGFQAQETLAIEPKATASAKA